MTIKEIENEIVEEFAVFTDWMDKYEYIIELGKGVPAIEERDKTEENLIKGCQSRVWLSCRIEDGKLYFAADSDAIITSEISTCSTCLGLSIVKYASSPSTLATAKFFNWLG